MVQVFNFQYALVTTPVQEKNKGSEDRRKNPS